MTAKQYLNQIRELDSEINRMQRHYDLLTRDRTFLKSPCLGRDRVQTSPDGSGFTRISDKIVDMQMQINRKIDELVDKRDLIIRQINSLGRLYSDSDYVDILFMRYVDYKKYKNFDMIADDVLLSYSRTVFKHGVALKLFYDHYLKNEKEA